MSFAWTRNYYAINDETSEVYCFESKKYRNDAVKRFGLSPIAANEAYKHGYARIRRISDTRYRKRYIKMTVSEVIKAQHYDTEQRPVVIKFAKNDGSVTTMVWSDISKLLSDKIANMNADEVYIDPRLNREVILVHEEAEYEQTPISKNTKKKHFRRYQDD